MNKIIVSPMLPVSYGGQSICRFDDMNLTISVDWAGEIFKQLPEDVQFVLRQRKLILQLTIYDENPELAPCKSDNTENP